MSTNVLITGISGHLGQALVRRLIADNPFDQVTAVDATTPEVLGPLHFVKGEVGRVDLGDLLVMNAVHTVLHLAHFDGPGFRTAPAVTARLVEAAELVGVRRVVVGNRDVVYAHAGEAATPRAEDTPLWTADDAVPPRVWAAAEVERVVEAAQGGETEVVSLRYCHVVGPRGAGPLDGFLELPWLPAPRRADPTTHLLHVDDAAEVLVRAVTRPDLRGAYNVGGAEPLRLSEVAGVLEKPFGPAPLWLARAGVELWRLGQLRRSPPVDPAHWHWTTALDCARLQADFDFTPRYTSRQALAVWRTGYIGP